MGGGWGVGGLLVSCVQMCEQNNDEKGYSFQAGHCAVMSSFRLENAVFWGKRYVFLQVFENTVNWGLI